MVSFKVPRGMHLRISLCIAWASALIAVSSPLEAAGLTLDQVLREGIARNHDLAAARLQVDAALGRVTQAGLRPNPRLELSNESDVVFGNEGEYSRSIGITQDFPITGRLARAQDVARVDVASALAEVNEAERKLLGEITSAYYDIVVLDQRAELRERLLRIDESLVADSTDRQKAGEVSELDVNTATLELERLRQEHTLLASERAAALKTLAGLVGYAADSTPDIDSSVPPITRLPPLAELTEQAINRRTDLRLLTLAADRARAEVLLADASAWEDWSVSLGIRQDRIAVAGAPVQPADKALMLSLVVPLPLHNRNQGTRAASLAEGRSADEQVLALTIRIENEVAGRHEQLSGLMNALAAYSLRTLPLSRRNTDLARDAYRQGQLSISDLVQAERQETDLNAGYADTLTKYLRTLAELNSAAVAFAPLMTHPVESPTAPPGDR